VAGEGEEQELTEMRRSRRERGLTNLAAVCDGDGRERRRGRRGGQRAAKSGEGGAHCTARDWRWGTTSIGTSRLKSGEMKGKRGDISFGVHVPQVQLRVLRADGFCDYGACGIWAERELCVGT